MSGIVTAFRTLYQLAYQVSPIILHNGIASAVPGGLLPFVFLPPVLAGGAVGALTGPGLPSLNDFPFQFRPIPGSTLISNTAGTYPYANVNVAGNAIVTQPLTISLRMIAPVNTTAGYITKLPMFVALQQYLSNHNNAGGTYIVVTPAFVYLDCIMTGWTDITGGTTKQDQVEFQLDFFKPLISLNNAAGAMSSLISKVAANVPG